MKIVAHVGVKDEIELIGGCLDHLRSIGVDSIVASDLGSTDGTRDLLRGEARAGLRLLEMDDADSSGIDALTRRSIAAIAEEGPDWVLFLDADERWLPATGQVRDCIDDDACDVLQVRRFNVVLSADHEWKEPVPDPSSYADVLLYSRPQEDFRRRFEEGEAPPWIRHVPLGKVATRGSRMGEITMGGHAVAANGDESVRQREAADLLIAHLPFTTPARFARKMRNVRSIFGTHRDYFGQGKAWHWRRWLDLGDAAAIDSEFRRQLVGADELDSLRRDGVIRSAAEILAG